MAAFIDESMRQNATGLCVVASVVIPGGHEAVRHRLRSLLLSRQPRFHWRAESELQRLKVLDVLSETAACVKAYSCSPVPRGKQPRARTQCLKQLLWDVCATDIKHLVIESRQDHNDQHDRQAILHAQRAGAAPLDLAYEFRRAHEEPLLWLADAAAGAVASREGDSVGHYAEQIAACLELTTVDL